MSPRSDVEHGDRQTPIEPHRPVYKSTVRFVRVGFGVAVVALVVAVVALILWALK